MIKRVELLAPCGSLESLYAAVNNGCDAVYLGLSNFGARAFADNFTIENIDIAIKYAHLHNVKVYVTMNTLLYQSEINPAMKQVEALYHADVDALIIQDLGLLELVTKCFPDFELHASTQMNINNVSGSKFIVSKGIKRVVLARETPIEVIKEVCRLGIDVEIFAYGALCVSYSGQCLISSVIKNRSGNRGVCAQLCRMPYRIFDFLNNEYITMNQEYLLSLKDLNLIDHIDELIESGVCSLKIEGRMKRPEYVAYVTRMFRKAIDSYYAGKRFKLSDLELIELKKLFNRGFTEGFIFGQNNKEMVNSFRPNHIGIEIGSVINKTKNKVSIKLSYPLHQFDGIRIINEEKDVGLVCNRIYLNGLLVNKADINDIIEMEVDNYLVAGDKVVLTSDYLSLKEIQLMASNDSNKQALRAKVILLTDDKIKISISSLKNMIELESDFIVQKASKHEFTKDRVIECIDSIADLPYYFKNLEVEKSDNIFVSVGALKNLRRDAIEKLMKLDSVFNNNRSGKKQYYYAEVKLDVTNHKLVEIFEENQYQDKAINFSNNKDIINDNIHYLPNTVDHYDVDNEAYSFVANLGNILKSKNYIATSALNVTNAYALKFLYDNGANCVILSTEVNQQNLDDMLISYKEIYASEPNVALLNKGRRTLMLNRYNYLLHYANERYALVIDGEKLVMSKDNLDHLKILESKVYISDLNSDLVSNKYIIKN